MEPLLAFQLAILQNASTGWENLSIEKFEDFAEIVEKNVAKFGLNDQVEIVKGDAIEVLSTLNLGEKEIDLAFIDGNKEEYLTYLEWSLERLSAKGIIIIDDIFFHGDVFNDVCETEKGSGVQAVIQHISKDTQLDYSFLPIANGLFIQNNKARIVSNYGKQEWSTSNVLYFWRQWLYWVSHLA